MVIIFDHRYHYHTYFLFSFLACAVFMRKNHCYKIYWPKNKQIANSVKTCPSKLQTLSFFLKNIQHDFPLFSTLKKDCRYPECTSLRTLCTTDLSALNGRWDRKDKGRTRSSIHLCSILRRFCGQFNYFTTDFHFSSVKNSLGHIWRFIWRIST